jgi:uncharacterized protein (UPF0335 family)
MAKSLRSETADKFGGAINAGALRGYVARVAALMEEQKGLAEDIKNACAEADEGGIASKRELRRLARESLMDHEVLEQQLSRMEDLRAALADYASTPLGAAAVEAEAEAEHDGWADEFADLPLRAAKPRAFAEQPMRPRGRPRKAKAGDALAAARAHFGEDEPAGNA